MQNKPILRDDSTEPFFGVGRFISTTQWHQHSEAQISCSAGQIMYIQANDCLFIVPPNMAIFIPTLVRHKASMKKNILVQSVLFDEISFERLPKRVQLIHVTEIIRQLISRICELKQVNKTSRRAENLTNVLLDEINASTQINYLIKVPTEPRLAKVYALFLKAEEVLPSIVQAAKCASVDVRTLTRLFVKEMGMNFMTWKQQFIFMRSLELLPKYKFTRAVAYRLGYNSESAFISMFKKMSGGFTPSYFRK